MLYLCKMDNLKKWKADPSKGEVFTPIGLVSKIIDKIPSHVWLNPKSLFLDPCMGKGTFLIEIVRRLVDIYGYSELDAKSRVFGYDIRVKYVNYLKRRGYVNVRHKDFLDEKIEMKFDVVLGNPPYQKQVGPKKTEAIWPKFVEKSFEICKEGGYVSLIHPNGWRNVDGNYKNVQIKIKSKNLVYLSINSVESGQEIFKVTTPFDWYLIQNSPNIGTSNVKFEDGSNKNIDLSTLELIPNKLFDKIINLIAKDNEEKIEVLHSYSDYETRKPYMSKNKTEENIHPCVYSILNNGHVNLMYSSINNKGHFGIPKVVVGNGANPTSFIDYDGKYGLTQFAFGIVESIDNLPKIEKVLKSKEFQKINLSTKYVATAGNPLIYPKIIKLFRKDFWKEFLDENGNVREI
jgi:type I restriction-modification system DNA methylase subunit